ncbi:hypothetical protein L1049_028442 [Liquidambar formosana]|uniref:Uncharacterized protein n=1 Tax=Liquidambar formosana TaxID=63359 RepID=A0AAP0RKE8_LIQFO
MDMWLVAAAAGAGYVAKHWQNLLKDRDSLSELSSGGSTFEKPESPPSIQQLNNKSCPSHSLAQRKKQGGDVSTEREEVSDTKFSEMSRSDGASVPEVACTSGFDGENLINLGNNEDCNLLSISSLPPGLLRNENLQENGDQSRVNDDSSGDLLPEPSTGELGSFHGSSWKRSSLRSKLSCGNIVKPLSSLESCLMAQLYKEHVEMEEYILSSLPSPSAPTMRPLLVTDGSQIISRASGDCFSAQIGMKEKKLHREPYSNEKEAVLGVPLLPHIGTAELPSKVKRKTGKDRGGRLGSSTKVVGGNNFHSHGGSTDGTLLFYLGFSIGIISSVMANKREVDKLKEVLKQTENLVQDLQ